MMPCTDNDAIHFATEYCPACDDTFYEYDIVTFNGQRLCQDCAQDAAEFISEKKRDMEMGL